MGISECLFALGRFDAAEPYADSALSLQRQKIPSGIYAETASALLLKARCRMGRSGLYEALALTDSALLACGYRGASDFGKVLAPLQLLEGLGYKGELYLMQYRSTGDGEALRASLTTAQEAAGAMLHFRTTLLENESKAAISFQFRKVLNRGIDAAYELHRIEPENPGWLEAGFALAEQSRALSLLEGLQEQAGLPDSIMHREQRLRRAVAESEIQLKRYLESGMAVADSTLTAIRNTLFERQLLFEDFQRGLRMGKYQSYYNFRYGVSLATVAEARRAVILPGQCLLEYFIGDSCTYVFLLKQDTASLIRLSAGLPLETTVESLLYGLVGYHTAKAKTDALRIAAANGYLESASALYTLLVKPVEPLLDSAVVVIPDGVLSYVPFETLLTGTVSNKSRYHLYPYWGNRRYISYAYSATLLREMRRLKHVPPASTTFAGFAPFFFGDEQQLSGISGSDEATLRNAFDTLAYSGLELYNIARMMQGAAFYGVRASREAFLSNASNARMIHLSTHGVADDRAGDFSYLVFAGTNGHIDTLFAKDIYALALKAELVVLSACETGTGAMQRGEGVISLARAFALAGAKSIVNTLWSVNDAASGALMVYFYAHLLAGEPKHLALSRAKREYIAAHPVKAHPFYWAGFILVGDPVPVN